MNQTNKIVYSSNILNTKNITSLPKEEGFFFFFFFFSVYPRPPLFRFCCFEMSDPELIIDRNSLKLPPVSLTMTVLIVLVGVLSWLKPLSVGALFAMHPLSVMPPKFHLWTLVTFVFVDLDPVNFFITLVSFPIFAKALETAYGGLALARYLAIVVVATGSVLFLVGLVEPLFVKNMVLWSETPKSALYGAQPIMIACLVAMKQVMKKKGGKKKKFIFVLFCS